MTHYPPIETYADDADWDDADWIVGTSVLPDTVQLGAEPAVPLHIAVWAGAAFLLFYAALIAF